MRAAMFTPAFFERVTRYQVFAIGVLCLGLLFVSQELALGCLAGGAVMAANFWAMRVLLAKIFVSNSPKPLYAVLAALKFVALLAAVFLLVHVLGQNPLGLVLGFSTLFVGMFIALLETWAQPKTTDSP